VYDRGMIQLVPVSQVLAANSGSTLGPTINVRDASQRELWASRLHVSQEDLSSAISEVGGSVAAIRRYLQGNQAIPKAGT
jgi:hypothetical protein